MSVADRAGKTPVPVSGPVAVAQIAAGFLGRALRSSKKTVYRIGGQRVSGPEFRSRVGVIFPGQRPAPPGKMPAPTVAVEPPKATRPADPGYRPDLTERKLPPLKGKPPSKPPPPPPGRSSPDMMPVPPRGSPRTLAFAGAWLRAAGYLGVIVYTVEWIARAWQEYFPGQPLPDKPPPKRKRVGGPGSQGGKGARYRPPRKQQPYDDYEGLPPETRQPIIFSPVINVTVPPQAREPTPKLPPAPAPPPAVATPMPAPTPAPAPPPPSTVTKTLPPWLQYAQYAGALLPLLKSKSRRKNRSRPTSPSPLPGIPGLTPGQNPELGLMPQLADYPLVSGGNYFESTPQQQKCDCAPKKRKKGPKKKRAVCYTGRFTERANGLRKYEKRKIKCR